MEHLKRFNAYARLKTWLSRENLEKAGKTKKELARIGQKIVFTDVNGKTHRPSQLDFTRTPDNRPTQDAGMYNLYGILAVLHYVGIIESKEEIEEFLEASGLDKQLPRGKTWTDIWLMIENGFKAIDLEKNVSSFPKNTAIAPIIPVVEYEKDVPLSKIVSVNQPNPVSRIIEDKQTVPDSKRKRWLSIALLSILLFGGGVFVILSKWYQPSSSSEQPAFSKRCKRTDTYLTPEPPKEGNLNIFSYNATQSGGLLSANVRTISQNENGVWVGYIADTDKGIDGISYHYHDEQGQGHWIHCSGLGLLPNQTVNDIAFGSDSIWVAIDARDENPKSPGIARLDKDDWQFYGTNEGLPSNIVYSLWIDESKVVWATTFNGVSRFNGTSWESAYGVTTEKTPADKLPCGAVAVMRKSSLGQWFGLVRCGVAYIIKGKWGYKYKSLTDPKSNVRAVEVDDPHYVWVATSGGGLLRYDGQDWLVLQPPNVPSGYIEDVKHDKYNRLWIATDKGVFYTEDAGKTWQEFTKLPSLKISFGCGTCRYTLDEVWLVLQRKGLGYGHLPPLDRAIEVIEVSPLPALKPKEPFQLAVRIRVLNESLGPTKSTGDALKIIQIQGPGQVSANPNIGLLQRVYSGQEYTFTNDEPITAPDVPGKYKLILKVWQANRFVSEPIMIEFEVVAPR